MNDDHLFPADLLSDIRSRFDHIDTCPFSGPRIFLDSASGSMRLSCVTEVVNLHTSLPDQLGRGNAASMHLDEVYEQGISDIRLFLGADDKATILSGITGSHTIFRVVRALATHLPGSNVVTSQLDHPAAYHSTRYFAERFNLEWRVAKLDAQSGTVDLDEIIRHIDSETRFLTLIHASNFTGAIFDIDAIVRAARSIKPDLFIMVDGIQYSPHAPVDVEKLDVDAYVISPYKVFCKKGIGFAYLSERLAQLPHLKVGGLPETEWGYCEDQAPYAAWSAAMDYFCWLGSNFTNSTDRRTQIITALEQMDKHERVLLQRLLHGRSSEDTGFLEMQHVKVHGFTGDVMNRVGTIIFTLDNMTAAQGVAYFEENKIRVSKRLRGEPFSRHNLEALRLEEVIRLSLAHHNTTDEIDCALDIARNAGM